MLKPQVQHTCAVAVQSCFECRYEKASRSPRIQAASATHLRADMKRCRKRVTVNSSRKCNTPTHLSQPACGLVQMRAGCGLGQTNARWDKCEFQYFGYIEMCPQNL